MGFSVWLRRKCLEMRSVAQGGQADQNDSPVNADSAGPSAIVVAFVGTRNGAPPSNLPQDLYLPPETPVKQLEKSMLGRSPSPLIPSFLTLMVFNTTQQLFFYFH